MKKHISSVLFISILSIFGCKSESDAPSPINTAPMACALTFENGTLPGSNYTNSYVYTDNGYLLKLTKTTTQSNGTINTISTQNTYDASNFLIKSVEEMATKSAGDAMARPNSKNTIDYTYQNGLLTEKTETFVFVPENPITSVIRTNHTYDAAKNVASMTVINTASSGVVTAKTLNYSYTNNVISGVSETVAGVTRPYTLQIDANGRITEETIAVGYRNVYTYDTEGCLTRREVIIGNKPNSTTEYQYDNKKIAPKGLEPKGQPVLKFYGNPPTHNVTNYYYSYMATTPNLTTTIATTYKYGTNDMPVSVTKVTNGGSSTATTETIVYSTSGCN